MVALTKANIESTSNGLPQSADPWCNTATVTGLSRLWVNRDISGAGLDFRFAPGSDQIATLRQPALGPDLPISA
jgi:hypothetical protein